MSVTHESFLLTENHRDTQSNIYAEPGIPGEMGQSDHIKNIGVIGAGGIVRNIHLPILKFMGNIDIAYVFDIDGDKSRELSNLYNTTHVESSRDVEAFPKCDAVLLGIPVGARDIYIEEYSQRETPIFSEKPFAASPQDHQRYLRLADGIACNYMRENYCAVNQVKQIIQSKIFGELNNVYISESKHGSGTGRGKGTYQTDVKLSGGGILMETGSHLLSQLVYIFEDYRIKVMDADVEYVKEKLDSHVKSRMEATNVENQVEIDLMLSSIAPIDTKFEMSFDHARICFNPADPTSKPQLIRNDTGRKAFSLSPDLLWPRSERQAIFARWRQFYSSCFETQEEWAIYRRDSDLTSVDTTRLIREIYEVNDDE